MKNLKLFFCLLRVVFFAVLLSCCTGNDDDDSDTEQNDTGGTDDTDDTDNTDDTDDTGFKEPRGACDFKTRVGIFEIILGVSESSINGTVADGVMPGTAPLEITTLGSCRLLKKNNPFCDPPCGFEKVCAEDNECIPYPTNQNIGVVNIDGLVEPIVLEPTDVSNLYFNTALTHPPFETQAEISLKATGGDHSGFSLYGKGIELLESDNNTWTLAKDQELTITWSKGTVESAVVTATVDVDQHGITPASIMCQGPDTGSFNVPVELVDQLLDLGISGFPAATLDRRSIDSVETDLGCVEFSITSSAAVKAVVSYDN
ncbi:MAG: hypothetical protein GY847_40915 [Proteobacteria bacterium]|nr:hypothetical protein [Pseudomonadota bacterium]